MNEYGKIDDVFINIHLSDLKVMFWSEWWNGTLFMHCTKYYLSIVLDGVKVKKER